MPSLAPPSVSAFTRKNESAAHAAGQTVGRILRKASTPARLRGFLYAAWVLSGLLFLIGEGTLAGARNAVKKVGYDAAPSILAAQEVSSALADLDTNAANYHLGTKVHQAAALQTFEQRRAQLTDKLVDAAGNVTFGEDERAPIHAIFEGLGRYLELVAEARYRQTIGDVTGAAGTYGAASDLMHQRLLPAADALDDANRKHLDHEYREQQQRSLGAEILAGLAGLALLGVLIRAQVFTLRRMHRYFNLPLLAASLVTIGFTVYLVTRIVVARDDLRLAKEDAFESIHALWKARAVAFDANGDESRYLLQGASAASSEAAFKKKVGRLTSMPEPSEAVLSDAARGKVTAELTGHFGDALRNVTFPGEREALLRMMREFARYHAVDDRIRAFEKAGRHDAAVQLCVGSGADESNAAFDRFDRALRAVIDLNHKEFDDAIKAGRAALEAAAYLVPLASILVALLAWLGIRPRLREYQA
jgi:hypothetical protein